jgi:aryl-alcohol dehydrogenase-like predicted oxidoreductase
MLEMRRLGRSEVEVSPLGLGCWQFSGGKGVVGSFWEALSQDQVNSIVGAALKGGVNWFDTAEAYGGGHSEAALATALHARRVEPDGVVIATKWSPVFRTAKNLLHSIEERLEKLGGFPIDLYQIHSPLSFSTVGTEMAALAKLVRSGKVKTVGVSNYPARMMLRAHRHLARAGIPLVSNQIRYSLLARKAEVNGVMEEAKRLGITIIAYSPLAQGILTGRFHADPALIRTRPGPRRRMAAFQRKGLEKTRPLVEALVEIGEVHGATPGQVALNWLMTFHGSTVVVIPGSSRPPQMEENAGAMTFTLDEEELARLDRISRPR